jgi:hypothetical protein
MAMATILKGTLVNTLIPAVSGLVGVAIGGWLTALNQNRERREAHIKSQLSELYSPLLVIRSQIKAKSELRLKLSSAAGASWPAKFAGIEDPVLKKQISERDGPAYDKLQDSNNRQLTEEIIPLYRKMLAMLRTVCGLRNHPLCAITRRWWSLWRYGIGSWTSPCRARSCSRSSTKKKLSNRCTRTWNTT